MNNSPEDIERERLEQLRERRRKRRERIGGGSNSEDGSRRIEESTEETGRRADPIIIEVPSVGGENLPNAPGQGERRSERTTERTKAGTADGRKGKTTKAEAKSLDVNEVNEDRQDLLNLIIGIGGNAANYTHFDGFQITEAEADTIALPLARILARHGLTESVRKYSDPFLVLTAIGSIAGPRMFAYKIWRQIMEQQLRQQYENANGHQPTAPTENGKVAPENTVQRFTGYKI